jgi:hypothetical protein
MSADRPVVALVGHSPRNWLHCADILVYEPSSEYAALAWLATVFGRYPGCVAALVRFPDRGLLMVRGQAAALAPAGWAR